ncbi:MAG: phenylacetate--CoA ligase family protein [Flavobacteriaceae bacterium]
MNWFDWSLERQGYPIKQATKDLEGLALLDPVAFEARQQTARDAIVAHHLAHTPYYQKLVPSGAQTPWGQLPIMTKADLQTPLKQRLAQGFTPANIHQHKTSGSSGHPFVFGKDRYCHARSWALIQKLYLQQGVRVGSDLEARFYGIPLSGWGYYKERLKDALARRYRFVIFDLSDDRLAQILETFKQRPFVFINGYTSSIVRFGQYLQDHGLVLKTICPTLTACIVTSEMLFDQDKALLTAALGVPILNEYGASELGVIAFQTKQGLFEVQNQNLYLELLDQEGQPVPTGTQGRIVVTDLYNKAHPLIRYDIGDLAIAHPDSTPTNPILSRLIGRTNDMAHLANGKIVPGLTFYYVTKKVIGPHSPVKEFIVEQNSPDQFTVVYVGARMLNSSEKNDIIQAMEQYVGGGLTVDFKHCAVLDRSRRGKLKQFISRL